VSTLDFFAYKNEIVNGKKCVYGCACVFVNHYSGAFDTLCEVYVNIICVRVCESERTCACYSGEDIRVNFLHVYCVRVCVCVCVCVYVHVFFFSFFQMVPSGFFP